MVEMGSLTMLNVALLIGFLACAMLTVYAIWTLLHTLAFLAGADREPVPDLLFAVFKVARFPIGAFPGPMQVVFTIVIPIAFMTTVPASAAAGMLDCAMPSRRR
jgi:ABC-2 type transport system permease protein